MHPSIIPKRHVESSGSTYITVIIAGASIAIKQPLDLKSLVLTATGRDRAFRSGESFARQTIKEPSFSWGKQPQTTGVFLESKIYLLIQ